MQRPARPPEDGQSVTSEGSFDVRGMGMGRGAFPRTFESFKLPVFRLYYAAMFGQMAAMNMQMMARSWFILELTGRPIMLGLMALANALPMLLFSLFGGAIADQVRKKYVLLAGQSASAILALAIAVSITLGSVTWVHLIVASLIQGTIMGLMMPSRQAIISEIVRPEQLMNAVALNSTGMNMNRLMAPAAAGFLIAVFGIEAVYYVMAGLYLVAVFFVSLMPLTGVMSLRGGGALANIRDGLKYVRSNTLILTLLVITLLTVVLSMPYMFLLPVFTKDILEVGPRGLGILMSVTGVGALVGSLTIASLPNKRRGALLLGSSGILGLGLLFFSFSSWWWLSLALMIPVGLGHGGRQALSNTLVQYYAADEYRGRVMSIYFMEFGLASFGTFFASVMAQYFDVRYAIGGMAAMLVLFVIIVLAAMPSIRRLD